SPSLKASGIYVETPVFLQDDLSHLRRTCSASAAFSMLLRLKRYLKSAYGLTPARLQAYKPNESTKVRL
ncbi:unnamed protein product, partial [Laminaria digitata]